MPTPETTLVNRATRPRIMETPRKETGTIWGNGMNEEPYWEKSSSKCEICRKNAIQLVTSFIRRGKTGKYVHRIQNDCKCWMLNHE